MRALIISCAIVGLIVLTGCAGVTKYKLTTPDGVVVEVHNSKDYEAFELNATKQADGSYSVKIIEKGVSASSPLKAARELNGQLIGKILGIVQ